MPKRSTGIPPLVYVRITPTGRRVPGLHAAAPRDGRVPAYARSQLLTLPAAQVSRARKPTGPLSPTDGSSPRASGSAASWSGWGRGR
jgi:hypothetical protein